jgi:hypothetical protein
MNARSANLAEKEFIILEIEGEEIQRGMNEVVVVFACRSKVRKAMEALWETRSPVQGARVDQVARHDKGCRIPALC